MTNIITEDFWVLTLSRMSPYPDDASAYEVNGEPSNLYFPTYEHAYKAISQRVQEYKDRGWEPVKALYVDMTVDSNVPFVTAIDELTDVPHQTMGAPQRHSNIGPAHKMALPPRPPDA